MGYCFQLRIYDEKEKHRDTFEYAGSYGAGTIQTFLEVLRTSCEKVGHPLPDHGFYFHSDTRYTEAECWRIVQCLDELQDAVDQKIVPFTDDHKDFLLRFYDVFLTAGSLKGYVEQHLSE
jgi:hypothetical protein